MLRGGERRFLLSAAELRLELFSVMELIGKVQYHIVQRGRNR